MMSSKTISSFILVAALVCSTPTQPINLNNKFVWAIAAVTGLHVYWANTKPFSLQRIESEESFVNAIQNARTADDVIDIVHRWIVGYPEKNASFKLNAEDRTRFAHEITVMMKKGTPAYGLGGVTWTLVKQVYDSLKKIKELNEMANYFDLTTIQ